MSENSGLSALGWTIAGLLFLLVILPAVGCGVFMIVYGFASL